MLAITAPAVPDIRQARARALCVAGGALAAAVAWTVEVPLLTIFNGGGYLGRGRSWPGSRRGGRAGIASA